MLNSKSELIYEIYDSSNSTSEKAVSSLFNFLVNFINIGVKTHVHCNAQCVLCKVRCHCIFYDAVSDTIRRRGGYRGIITEEGVDTVTYFGGNHGSRV